MSKKVDVRKELVALEPLDLRKLKTVGQIVEGLSKCSFGARMLGEVALTWRDWIASGAPPLVVYDGSSLNGVGGLLQEAARRGWCADVVTAETYATRDEGENVVAVGRFSQRHDVVLFNKPVRALFVNEEYYAPPGQIRDGYFPDAVFADPRMTIPIILMALQEWLTHVPVPVGQLLKVMESCGGEGKNVRKAADTLWAMVEDPDVTTIWTAAGALTIAQQSLVLCDMLDYDMAQALATTGALMAHGLVEGLNLKHYKNAIQYDDEVLRDQKLNRVSDTIEPEENFSHVADALDHVLNTYPDEGITTSPTEFHTRVGRYLHEQFPEYRAILKSAFVKHRLVFVPAFVDSEIGNDVFVHNKMRAQEGRGPVLINMELDSQKLIDLVTSAKKVGIFSVGGGTPGNNTRNVAPLIEIHNERLGTDLPERKFSLGVKIAPDRVVLGNYGSATFQEMISWRKAEAGGLFAEICSDGTIVLGFLVRYVMDKKGI